GMAALNSAAVASGFMGAPLACTAGMRVAYIHAHITKVQSARATTGCRIGLVMAQAPGGWARGRHAGPSKLGRKGLIRDPGPSVAATLLPLREKVSAEG